MSVSAHDLSRAFEFLVRNDCFGTRVEAFEWGRAVCAPELPLRHDSNYLFLESLPPHVDAGDVVARAETLQAPQDLPHRCVFFRHAEDGERLAPGLEERGWTVFRGVLMARRRREDRRVGTHRVEELARLPASVAEMLAAARETQILAYPWGTAEVARQLVRARLLAPVPTRTFVVREGGVPVAWVELYVEGRVAQVEALATDAAHRGKGHARALLQHAVEAALGSGAELVFLCADEDDWPHRFYGRMGFDLLGRYVKASRVLAGGTASAVDDDR